MANCAIITQYSVCIVLEYLIILVHDEGTI